MVQQSKASARLGSYSENDLVQDVHRLLPTFLKKRRKAWIIDREVGVGRAIADIVVLLRPPRGWLLPEDSLTVSESVIIAALRRRGRTRIDLLEQQCRLPRGALRSGAIERLEDWGIIEFGAGGSLFISPAWRRHTTLLAIEVKLTRWRDALKQARVYQQYADDSYIAIPHEFGAPALRNESLFQETGVGLMLVYPTKLVAVFPSTRSTTSDWRREFVYSRMAIADSHTG